jgi:hypothetical protein
MANSKDVKLILASLKVDVIDTICEAITNAKALEIRLNEPISYQYIDEQANQSIDRVNAEQKSVEVDAAGFGDDFSIKLNELDIDILLSILECIEGEHFEVWEQIED